MLDELWESPAFWILGGFGVIAEVLGYILSRQMGVDAFPFWQFLVLIFGTLVAAALFALKE